MKRIPQLDGLRGIAVLMVFVYHAFHVSHAARGVDLFFVLSGYLITGILLRSKEAQSTGGYFGRFYLRRARRILPAYVGFLVFVTLAFTVPWHKVWYWYAFFGANIAAAFGKTPIGSMDPLWSLAVEEQFYFLWPLVVLLCSRRTLRNIALGIIVLSPILRAVVTPFTSDFSIIYCLTPFRIDMLACGAFIAVSEIEDAGWVRRHGRAAFYTILGVVAALAALTRVPGFRIIANTVLFNSIGYTLIAVGFGATMLWSLTLSRGPVYWVLTSRPLRFMGLISYTFYLYQLPFLEKIGERIHGELAVAAVGFVATAVFSTLSWYCFEAPILRGRSRETRKPAASAPAEGEPASSEIA